VHAQLEASRISIGHFDELVVGKFREFLNPGNVLVRSRMIAEKRPPENLSVEDLLTNSSN
jgi:hypothetical protein